LAQDHKYYVYIFRDERGIPRYVGRGKDSQRPMAHGTLSGHNKDLDHWIQEGRFSLEICGPFPNEETSQIVEGAVMSALSQTPRLKEQLYNKVSGHSAGQFRPIAVPLHLAGRSVQPSLTTGDLDELTNSDNPLLFVYINGSDFSDGRKGYDVAHIPEDAEIADRAEKFWQLARFLPDWRRNPNTAPTHLVAVSGPRERRFVVACSEILLDEVGFWRISENMIHPGGLVTVPIKGSDLDALELRGRRISADVPITFGSFRHSVFRLYPPPKAASERT
jgi:hypothetical protein